MAARVREVHDQIDGIVAQQGVERRVCGNPVPLAECLRAARIEVGHATYRKMGVRGKGDAVVVGDEAASDDRDVHRGRLPIGAPSFAECLQIAPGSHPV